MTAKHDFIADNPHIAYSGKPDTSTPGIMLLRLTIDTTDEVHTLEAPNATPAEVLEAMKAGIVINTVASYTASGVLAGGENIIGVIYSIEENAVMINTQYPAVGDIASGEWALEGNE